MADYRLDLTESQLRVVNNALEEYFRIPLNQWGDLAERLASKGVDLTDDKTRDRNFDRYIEKRNAVNEIFEAAGRVLWGYQVPPKDEEQLIAEDIWQVIRHQLYLDSGSTDEWRVDAREAIQWGPEPLPRIERVDGQAIKSLASDKGENNG